MGVVSSPVSRARLIIADDHAIFSETLRAYLEKSFNVVGVVPDGRSLVKEAVRLQPDVIIVDVGMPLLNGFDAAQRVRKEAPHVKFVFLTMQNDPNLAAAALELGPVGFVLKNADAQELMKAIHSVLRGTSYVTPKMRPQDWTDTKQMAKQFSKELTPRQRDIVQLLAEGRSLKEIAWLLDLSHKTVEFHKHQIREAYHLASNADLVLFAVKQGLIHLNP
jgi:DNA-binding NarL/FixJ family response regulator